MNVGRPLEAHRSAQDATEASGHSPDDIPLVTATITEDDRRYLCARIQTGLLDDETEIRRFEEAFAAYTGTAGCVAVNSGMSALIIALATLKHTGLVLLPTYTCRALLDAVYAVGAHPYFLDNERDVRHARYGVRASGDSPTIVSHMFGTAATIPTGANIVEDLTLSLGATPPPWYGVCSFAADKMISTGRGGAVISQDLSFLDAARELAHYDQPVARSGRSPKSQGRSARTGYTPRHSYAMSSLQAALGNSQLHQLSGFIERRRQIAAHYSHRLDGLIPTPDPDCGSVFFRYLISVADPAATVLELAEHGIETGRGVNPLLHRLLGLPDADFPNATRCAQTLLSIPVHPSLSDDEVEYIADTVALVCG